MRVPVDADGIEAPARTTRTTTEHRTFPRSQHTHGIDASSGRGRECTQRAGTSGPKGADTTAAADERLSWCSLPSYCAVLCVSRVLLMLRYIPAHVLTSWDEHGCTSACVWSPHAAADRGGTDSVGRCIIDIGRHVHTRHACGMSTARQGGWAMGTVHGRRHNTRVRAGWAIEYGAAYGDAPADIDTSACVYVCVCVWCMSVCVHVLCSSVPHHVVTKVGPPVHDWAVMHG